MDMSWQAKWDEMDKPYSQGVESVSGLCLHRLCKAFGSVQAVQNVELQIRRGEFLTLLGPSGSGKTTLLMMIAGFLDPARYPGWRRLCFHTVLGRDRGDAIHRQVPDPHAAAPNVGRDSAKTPIPPWPPPRSCGSP